MAPESRPERGVHAPVPNAAVRAFAALGLTLVALAHAPAAHALRVVNWNILNYPGAGGAAREPYFRTVLAPLGADVIVVQEMQSDAGVNSFRDNVLNVIEPGQWASAPFINGNDTDNALFYKPAKVQFLGQWAWYPNPANLLRLVNCYRLKPVGYSAAAAELRVYSQHLKASTGFESQRLAEATGIRDSMNAAPPGTHCILTGDFNIYSGAEPAFTKLLESQADNDGRLYDPLNAPAITWNTGSLATIHTQSPCLSGCLNGAASGGLDDRFDMFLPTYNLNDGQGLDLLAVTYQPIGNDGQHYNKNLTDTPTIPEGSTYATALWNASDHLPLRVDVQLPAKISAPAALAFGSVIAGGPAAQNLAIGNAAAAPADALTYGMAADPAFSAPGGTFNVAAGAAPGAHSIGMSTATAGVKNGALTISSDDVDLPAAIVTLSGTVLDHAQASLDSSAAVTAQTLDFGSHAPGGFATRMARVHDRGYSALRAKLAVNAAIITGGDGRFSIAGGFTPSLVAGTAATHTVQFDDAGASPDTDYDATLTFSSADEPLPGAVAQPDLVVSLHAHVAGGVVSAPGPQAPARTQFHPPAPNPVADRTELRLDLAASAATSLDIFDLAGRRVASFASGTLPAGAYRWTWDGRDASGAPLGSGLYFVRLTLDGRVAGSARLALVR
jgi:endonuclease/exonuclease/phosphatase family metal-dependent hydrolase